MAGEPARRTAWSATGDAGAVRGSGARTLAPGSRRPAHPPGGGQAVAEGPDAVCAPALAPHAIG
ncbi:hypothetical protein GCM10010507_30150 [Streptomyces cinnamoneus]|uniref:Uncharacterized protein n=1 Tax=Streptomyces cinnamoneus TaxID=53446 RepID=A0A918WJH2_STRCJ|nr:hypothetical protein GCM10010507_30150 [Streptomyces cinnamoneus]